MSAIILPEGRLPEVVAVNNVNICKTHLTGFSKIHRRHFLKDLDYARRIRTRLLQSLENGNEMLHVLAPSIMLERVLEEMRNLANELGRRRRTDIRFRRQLLQDRKQLFHVESHGVAAPSGIAVPATVPSGVADGGAKGAHGVAQQAEPLFRRLLLFAVFR